MVETKTGPPIAGLFDIRAKPPQSPAAPVPVMVPAMPTMVTVPPPPYFRGRRLGILLDRRGGAGVAERQRLGALGRSGQDEQCANGGKPQNFRHLHM